MIIWVLHTTIINNMNIRMKHMFFCICLILFTHGETFTQTFPTIVVKAGTRILDYFPYNKRYMYPEFLTGRVLFINGSVAENKMNYNLLMDEIQFLGGRGDTLIITGKNNIRQVVIRDDLFCYDGGFLRLVMGDGDLKIAQKHYFKFLGAEKYEAYGMTSSISSLESLRTYLPAGGTYTDLVIAQDLKFKETIEYHISSDGDKFYLITKSVIKKLYPEHKKEIKDFLKEHDVDFDNEMDLMDLYGFLSGLPER